MLLVLVAALPLAALTIDAHLRQRRVAMAQYRESAVRTVVSIALDQQRIVDRGRDLLSTVGASPELRERRPECTRLFESALAISPYITNLAAATADGTIVCSAMGAHHPNRSPASEAWFRRVLEERRFVVGKAQIGGATNKAVFVLAAPVIEAGRIRDVVFAGVEVAAFDRFRHDAELPDSVVMAVNDDDTRIVWRSLESERYVGTYPPRDGVVTQAMLRDQRGAVEAPGLDGQPRLYAFATWGEPGAHRKYVMLGFPQAQAVTAFNTALRWSLGGLLLVVLATALVVYRSAEALVVRPVRGLALGTTALAAGALTTRVEPSGSEELAALAVSFNAMAESLERHREERDAADAALRQAQGLLSDMLEAIPIGVIVVERDGAQRYINRAAREMLGPSLVQSGRAEWLSARLPLHFASSHAVAPVSQRPLYRALSGERVHSTEFEVVAPDRTIPCEIWGSPIFGPDGSVTHAIVAFQDLTEQRGLEDQFRQAQKMEAVGRLAGGVAHDFNNLLTVVLGYADMLLEEPFIQASPIVADLQAIREAGDRARGLTQQLLAFSRKQLLQPQAVNLNDLLRKLARMLRRLLGEDVDLRLELDEGVPQVSVDPGQFDQMVMNLAINARDAMPDGGVLTIATSVVAVASAATAPASGLEGGTYVLVTIRDNGCGMDEATKSRIFEPFFTTKERGKGTGLGLATVYGIVRQSGGGIAVESRPGDGAVFQLYLPTMSTSSPSAHAGGVDRAASDGNEAILVVEDDQEVLRFTTRVLEQRGYRILTATSPEAALALLRDHPQRIDLLLTDIILKGINGRRLAVRVTEERPGIVVLLMSGYTEEQTHALDEPLSAPLLRKPFTPKQLAAMVRQTLDAPRTTA